MLRLLAVAVVFMTVASAATAQPTDQTATQFYMSYKAAFAKATKMEDLLPYMSKAKVSEVHTLPAAEWPKAFAMIKGFYMFTDEKVVKETKTADGATLDVEALDPDKKKYKATVELVREGNAWKFSQESWSPAP